MLRKTSRVLGHEAISKRTRPRFVRTVSRCSCGRSLAFPLPPSLFFCRQYYPIPPISSLPFCLARPASPAQPAHYVCRAGRRVDDYATTLLYQFVCSTERGRKRDFVKVLFPSIQLIHKRQIAVSVKKINSKKFDFKKKLP